MKKIIILVAFMSFFTSCADEYIRERDSLPFTVTSVKRLDYYDDFGNKMPTLYKYEISNKFDDWELLTEKIYAVNDTIKISKK